MNTNSQQRIPPLFVEIIENEGQRKAMMSQQVIPFVEATTLIARKKSLHRDAERALSWNANKGSTA